MASQSNTRGYGQFCPVARAAEVLTERWAPLLIRELLSGSTRFSELQRGLPRISTAMLSRRLKDLEFAGIVESVPAERGRGSEYRLTQAGRELAPVIEGMGIWAQRWLRNDLTRAENLDPDLLMWDVRRTVKGSTLPADRRFVAEFNLSGVPANRRNYWLVFENCEADLCVRPPGFATDLLVASHLKDLIEVWLGHVPVMAAIRDGRVRLDGNREDKRAFPAWFTPGFFAGYGRLPAGR